MKRTAKLAACVVFLSLGVGILLKGNRSDRVGKWTATSSLKTPRSGACSALLPDGHVLITGGEGPYGALASAEIYDVSGASSEAASMAFAHSNHACVALDGGRVLVAGGKTSGDGATNQAEIYDPATRAWTAIAPMTTPRSG